MKKKLSLALASAMVIGSTTCASAEILINGASTPKPGYIDENGVAMIQVRELVERMGCDVGFIPETQTVTITQKEDYTNINSGMLSTIESYSEIALGNNKIWKNYGVEVLEMSAAAGMLNGSTYVPLRSVVEALGGTVEWDASTGDTYVKSFGYLNGCKVIGGYRVPRNTTIECSRDEDGLEICLDKEYDPSIVVNEMGNILMQKHSEDSVHELMNAINDLCWNTAEDKIYEVKNGSDTFYVINNSNAVWVYPE